ncbi:hypothetical protein V5799_031134 [Amblyomma americanum]|uniref:Uncharacterized protein n=1 Tax=Amblyomma americanum TaxID=6943 RepID=A0AAQ4EL48_AMBAM
MHAAKILNDTSSTNEKSIEPSSLIRKIRGKSHLEFCICSATVNGKKCYREEYRPLFAGKGVEYNRHKRYIGFMNLGFEPVIHNGVPTMRITFGSCIMKPYTQNFDESSLMDCAFELPEALALELPENYVCVNDSEKRRSEEEEENEDKQSAAAELSSVTSEDVDSSVLQLPTNLNEMYGTAVTLDDDELEVDLSGAFHDRPTQKRQTEDIVDTVKKSKFE